MTGHNGEKKRDATRSSDQHTASGEVSEDTPQPADIAAEEPDTTDAKGMPLENPSGG